MMARAREIMAETGGFANRPVQQPGHDRRLLWGWGASWPSRSTEALDAFCAYVGTAGCLVGTCRGLRERFPEMQRVAIEPEESAVLSGRPAGTHRIEGGGSGFRPPLLAEGSYDEVQTVSTAEAMAMARRAAKEEGVFGGALDRCATSVVALRLAARSAQAGAWPRVQVATSGIKYLGRCHLPLAPGRRYPPPWPTSASTAAPR